MIRTVCCVLTLAVVCGLACIASAQEIIDPAEARNDPDYSIQGEYAGEGLLPEGQNAKLGAQVIALGDGKFRAVVYHGGLPGDGWSRGDEQLMLEGRREQRAAELTGEKMQAKIADGKMTITDADGKQLAELKRTERKSPTLEAKPPEGAVVLFDGTSVDHFPGATLTEMKTLEAGCTSQSKFHIKQLHLEFRLSYKPKARGQGRSNSGVYVGGCPEIQVLDSFGLEGRSNECGGLYGRREPEVNMCLPPLSWQTFEVELAPPKYEGDKMVARARLTVRHNGVVIHRDYELSGRKPGARGLHLQRHGNRVQYRNIWLVEEN